MMGLTPAYRIKLISTEQESGGERGKRGGGAWVTGKTTTREQEEEKRKTGVQQEGGAEEPGLVFCWMLGEEVGAWGEETGLATGWGGKLRD